MLETVTRGFGVFWGLYFGVCIFETFSLGFAPPPHCPGFSASGGAGRPRCGTQAPAWYGRERKKIKQTPHGKSIELAVASSFLFAVGGACMALLHSKCFGTSPCGLAARSMRLAVGARILAYGVGQDVSRHGCNIRSFSFFVGVLCVEAPQIVRHSYTCTGKRLCILLFPWVVDP